MAANQQKSTWRRDAPLLNDGGVPAGVAPTLAAYGGSWTCLGEVALVPRGAHRVGGHVDGDAEVMAREANVLDAVLVEVVQDAQLEQADILPRDTWWAPRECKRE